MARIWPEKWRDFGRAAIFWHHSCYISGEVNVMELEKMKTEILREQQLYREVVAILMGSEFYFDLTLDERYRLVKHILANSCLSVPEGSPPRNRRREISH